MAYHGYGGDGDHVSIRLRIIYSIKKLCVREISGEISITERILRLNLCFVIHVFKAEKANHPLTLRKNYEEKIFPQKSKENLRKR